MADHLWAIPDVIEHLAEHTPDKQWFIFINKYGHQSTLTNGGIYLLAGRFASRLRQCGFAAGDVIANGVPNSPERVVTDFGIIMAGCVSLNCQIIEKDGGDFWNTAIVSGCKGAIYPDRLDNPACRLFTQYIQGQGQNVAGYRDIVAPKAPLLTKAFVITRSKSPHESQNQASSGLGINCSIARGDSESVLADLIESQEDPVVTRCSPDDDAYIFTTSGSTGPCKLVPRTHRELLRMARGYSSSAELKYFNDRHMGFLGGFPFDYLQSRTPRLLQDCLDGLQAQTVAELWSVLAREQCDGAHLSPSDVTGLVSLFEDAPSEFKLKFITTSGVSLKQNAVAALGTITDHITNMYASTEVGIMALLSVKDASEFKDCACGRAPSYVQIRVVDDNMEDLPAGVEGQVVVKSQNMFRHYYNWTPPEPVFTPDGWFMTRDRGVMDQDGILSVPCRQGDVISQGVALIYLSWPEAVLSKCPGVSEVAAIGLKDGNEDDLICACVVPRKDSGLTEDRLLHFYNEHFMLSLAKDIHKPQIRLVIFYDTLPFNSARKLDKRKLREDAMRKLEQA